MRSLFLILVLAGCGPDYAITRYTFNVTLAAPDWVDASVVQGLEVSPCTNAVLYDETLVVYQGYDAEAVTAIRFNWSGFDLSQGGDNSLTWFLREDDVLQVPAALNPSLMLYEIDSRGRMLELDKDLANVRRKKSADAQYILGEGLEVFETHKRLADVEQILLQQEGNTPCDGPVYE